MAKIIIHDTADSNPAIHEKRFVNNSSHTNLFTWIKYTLKLSGADFLTKLLISLPFRFILSRMRNRQTTATTVVIAV